MSYKRAITGILDSLGANKSYTGYDYVVYGLLLMLEEKESVTCITKSLYIDIAKQYNTTWNCVEKNIRTVVKSVWNSANSELLKKIFKRSTKEKKPTNKEFFKYMYDYIMEVEGNLCADTTVISGICPISNRYCESLSVYYTNLFNTPEEERTKLYDA